MKTKIIYIRGHEKITERYTINCVEDGFVLYVIPPNEFDKMNLTPMELLNKEINRAEIDGEIKLYPIFNDDGTINKAYNRIERK